MYDESADSNLGPFTVDARLTSVGGSVLYATGEGRVSSPANLNSADMISVSMVLSQGALTKRGSVLDGLRPPESCPFQLL